jgi:prophage regulatory protein
MKLLRIKEVIAMTGLSRMSIYRYERNGDFPKRRRLGHNSVAWLEDIAVWVTARPMAAPHARGLETLLVVRRQ